MHMHCVGIPIMHAHAHIITLTTFTYLIKIGVQAACLHCMALLHIQLNHVEISGQFFFLFSVWAP